MAFHPPATAQTVVVRCKRCEQIVPAGDSEVPQQWRAVTCGLCSERRRYLPTEMFIGKPSYGLNKLTR